MAGELKPSSLVVLLRLPPPTPLLRPVLLFESSWLSPCSGDALSPWRPSTPLTDCHLSFSHCVNESSLMASRASVSGCVSSSISICAFSISTRVFVCATNGADVRNRFFVFDLQKIKFMVSYSVNLHQWLLPEQKFREGEKVPRGRWGCKLTKVIICRPSKKY